MEDNITVLVVDDHTVVRQGLRAMLDTESRIEVIGEAANGLEALQLVDDLKPDVVLMDIRMPQMDGLEATRRLKARHPTTSVIVMTNYQDDALVVNAVQSGASGYLLKDSSRELLSSTVFAVISGGVLIDGSLLRRAYDSVQSSDAPTDEQYPEGGGEIALSNRERKVLLLLSEGHTNRDMAEKMALAEVTIKKTVHRLIKRLGASDRTHAAILAMRLGLIK